MTSGAIISLLYITLAGVAVWTNAMSLGSAIIIMVIAVFGYRIEYEIHQINERQSRQKDPWD